jgi:adenosylcobinamide-phosphate synthase
MMLILHIWAALGLDALIGDPRSWPHPVKVIGALAQRLEPILRRRIASARTAGCVTAVIVIGGTALITWICLIAAGWIGAWLQTFVAIFLLYTTFAARDLRRHGIEVLAALRQDDLNLARQRVAMIVGRDTAGLDPAGVIRAAVESIAENTIDGIIAPLFFAFLGGPVAAMAYKAASTLDSTFGYRNERYIRFGWASARIDDVANYLPARIGAVMMAMAAWVLGENPWASLKAAWRDSRNHRSPNSGWGEAAMAGALGVQLGGPVWRGGQLDPMPPMGDARHPLTPDHIRRACRLMIGATVVAAVVFSIARFVLLIVGQ